MHSRRIRPAASKIAGGVTTFFLELLRAGVHSVMACGPCCGFSPSCSRYAKEAFIQKNIFRAGILIVWRLMRCHPFSTGGFDPVIPDGGGANGS